MKVANRRRKKLFRYPDRRVFVSRLFRSALIPLLVIVLVVWLASKTLMSKPSHGARASVPTPS